MIRPANTITHLAELPARRERRTAVSGFDSLFVGGAALALMAGCAVLLDQGASYSSGQGSLVADWFYHASTWIPGAVEVAGKYLLLFLASILNSALLVVLVQGLRMMDKVLRCKPCLHARLRSSERPAPYSSAPLNSSAPALSQEECGKFLLCPVFR